MANPVDALVNPDPAPHSGEAAESPPILLWKPWQWWRIVPLHERLPAPPPSSPAPRTLGVRLLDFFLTWAPLIIPMGILVVAWFYRPYSLTGPDVCGLRRATGIPCPGCGMTRSFCCMSHGELSLALGFHGLGPVCFAAMVLYLGLVILRKLGWLWVEFRPPRGFWWTTILIFLGWYAVRLFIFFATPEHLDAMQGVSP